MNLNLIGTINFVLITNFVFFNELKTSTHLPVRSGIIPTYNNLKGFFLSLLMIFIRVSKPIYSESIEPKIEEPELTYTKSIEEKAVKFELKPKAKQSDKSIEEQLNEKVKLKLKFKQNELIEESETSKKITIVEPKVIDTSKSKKPALDVELTEPSLDVDLKPQFNKMSLKPQINKMSLKPQINKMSQKNLFFDELKETISDQKKELFFDSLLSLTAIPFAILSFKFSRVLICKYTSPKIPLSHLIKTFTFPRLSRMSKTTSRTYYFTYQPLVDQDKLRALLTVGSLFRHNTSLENFLTHALVFPYSDNDFPNLKEHCLNLTGDWKPLYGPHVNYKKVLIEELLQESKLLNGHVLKLNTIKSIIDHYAKTIDKVNRIGKLLPAYTADIIHQKDIDPENFKIDLQKILDHFNIRKNQIIKIINAYAQDLSQLEAIRTDKKKVPGSLENQKNKLEKDIVNLSSPLLITKGLNHSLKYRQLAKIHVQLEHLNKEIQGYQMRSIYDNSPTLKDLKDQLECYLDLYHNIDHITAVLEFNLQERSIMKIF